ncbi:ankyrin repeat-containing protein ITN1 isoform X4 [Gossypium hirsutum]|uniref:Ankyrin repeat-containing protein ITN1 isoform X4 n=1 Tax=Gossypium hirsutum TaxID=3635 RepID=A0ABM3AVU2_GOSHI|nr:ankyrin repeat-containing protein ITN1-like isoform X4 [Gossypium hirsutum]
MDIDSQMMKTASGEDFNMEVSEIQASVVNEVNELGETALFTAAKKGHLDVVKELLKYSNKETVTKKNKSRLDPLHIAASQGHHDAAIVMLLDKFGNTAPHVATRKKRAEVIIERYSRTDLPDIEKSLLRQLALLNRFFSSLLAPFLSTRLIFLNVK